MVLVTLIQKFITFDKKDRSINDVSFLASWYDTDRQGYGIRKEVWDRQEEIDYSYNVSY